jgi:glycosyl transferase-like sugar-binding protein
MELHPPVHMLWIGPRLSALERLSIASFLANGHEVRLYTYGDVEGIPPGTQHHDGREIVPAAQVFTYPSGFGKGSYAGFSNLFRYKLLLDHGGIWCDCDVVCLQPFDFASEYVIARERLSPNLANADKTEKLNPCVLKAPPNSRVMLECYSVAMESNKGELEWGDIGPDLVTKRFAQHGLDRHALPANAICPVDWWHAQRLVKGSFEEIPGAYAVHFWNEVWRFQRMDKDAVYPADSIYETLKRRYGVGA